MTTAERFDVVVVGARCAGAALATHLTHAGCSVVVLEAATLSSNQPASTHLVQPPGMDELDRLGAGDAVRALAPALHSIHMEFDGRATRFSYGPGRAAHCLRRDALDGRLQDAAREAGARLVGRTRVVAVVRDRDGSVAGVETRSHDGERGRFLAPLVVGADGRNSTVAKLVGAPEYLGYDAPRGCYWTYWRRLPGCDPHVILNCFLDDHARIVFPADGGLLLVGTAPPVDRARAWQRDHTAAYLADVRSDPTIAPLLDSSGPVAPVRGVVHNRYFFRQSAGRGWALVGDAGHHKDFVIGLGISDALRDARSLAEAVVAGGAPSMERYWRGRDAARLELFLWSGDLGAADRVNGLERLVGERASHVRGLHARLGAVIDGRLSPYALIPAPTALRWATAALVRGHLEPVHELARTARRRAHARRQLARAGRLVRRAASGSIPGSGPTSGSGETRCVEHVAQAAH